MANIKLPAHKVEELKEVCKQFDHQGSELINVLHAAHVITSYSIHYTKLYDPTALTCAATAAPWRPPPEAGSCPRNNFV